MNHFAFLLACLAASPASAAAVRYRDSVFAAVTETRNLAYATSKTHTGATETQLLDLYEPQGDTAAARPVIIWVHGGGFSGGTKDDADVVALCRIYARKGYVTASINYRLRGGMTTQAEMGAQVWRALQDAKASVRFLRASKDARRLDADRMLMGGTSAGGVITLGCLYLDDDEAPSSVDVGALGGLDGSGGNPGVSSRINGGINCWGSVGDSTVLYDGALPVLSFHGTADKVVPYDIGYALGNPNLVSFGSACVHRVLTRYKVPSTLKTFQGMGHGIPGGDKRVDTLLTMTTDFAYATLFPDGAGLRPFRYLAPARASRGFRADGRILPAPRARKPALP